MISDRAHIPEKVFEKIQQSVGLPGIVQYTQQKLETILAADSGRVTAFWPMCLIEKDRLGSNKFFTNQEDGWIEIIQAQI